MSDWAIFHYGYLQHAVAAGFFAGIGCALAGAFVITMNLSFLGVCIAHAAFAGAMFSLLIGIPPMAGALIVSLLTAGLIGPVADRGELSVDTSIGILFSAMLGLAFLFAGMLPDSRAEAMALFWGSILTITSGHLAMLALTAGILLLLIFLFYKEIHAVVCHRSVALAVGIPATLVFYLLLIGVGAAIAVALPSIGGLLVYSLVINPAAAAYQLTYRFSVLLFLSALLGVLSCWIGLALSWTWNLPVGATIVLVSTAIFGFAALFSPKRRKIL